MQKVSVFGHLGLYIVPSFLPDDVCVAIYDEMLASGGSVASVYYGLDIQSRSVLRVEVSECIRVYIRERLTELLPVLSLHFSRPLQSFQELNFLVYREGDFYVPHIDCVDEPGFPDYVRNRRVSVVIFVNSCTETATASSFSGGELSFFGLLKEVEHIGLPLAGEAGMLVAFPSELCHEVRPVVQGVRCTIATWFV